MHILGILIGLGIFRLCKNVEAICFYWDKNKKRKDVVLVLRAFDK